MNVGQMRRLLSNWPSETNLEVLTADGDIVHFSGKYSITHGIGLFPDIRLHFGVQEVPPPVEEDIVREVEDHLARIIESLEDFNPGGVDGEGESDLQMTNFYRQVSKMEGEPTRILREMKNRV